MTYTAPPRFGPAACGYRLEGVEGQHGRELEKKWRAHLGLTSSKVPPPCRPPLAHGSGLP